MKKVNEHPVRLERLRRGWSQQQLADFAQISLNSVVHAEQGKPLRVDICRRLCDLLGKEKPEDLGLRCIGMMDTQTTDSNKQISEQVDTTSINAEIVNQPTNIYVPSIPRQLQSMPEAYSGPLYVPSVKVSHPHSITPHSVNFPHTQHKSSLVDDETLDHLKTLIETCFLLSQKGELKIAEATLWGYLPRLTTLTSQAASKQQETLATLTAKGYLLAASLTGHLYDDLAARYTLSEQALLYARLSGDENLLVSALRQIAVTFDYQESPVKALQTYQQAIPLLPNVSPLLRSRMYAGLAGAYAQVEQQQEAIRFIQLAYEHFPEHPESDPSVLHADTNYFIIVGWDALIHTTINQPMKAWQILTHSHHSSLFTGKPLPEKTWIEILNYQAEALLYMKELEQCGLILEEAVHASRTLNSERRYSESFAVYQKMRVIWPHEKPTKVLGELFHL